MMVIKMSKINTNKWHNYKMSEIGFKNYHGKRLTKKDRKPGLIPFLTAGYENQGIAEYIDNDLERYDDSITVDMFGNAFYHDYTCSGDDNIYFFINDNLGKYEKLFIVSSINSINRQKYAFKNQFRQNDADELSVKLPSLQNGKPDWDNIIEYMKREENYINQLIKTTDGVIDIKPNLVSTKGWGEFIIGKLFEIISPKVYHTCEVNETENGIPYIVRSKFNNGMKYRVEKKDEYKLNPSGVISFGAENASFFYQEEEYISGRDMYYIDTRDKSENVCLFLITCFETVTHKYSYNYGLFPKLLKKEKIELPIDKNGNPDWDYMDNYIQNIKIGKDLA